MKHSALLMMKHSAACLVKRSTEICVSLFICCVEASPAAATNSPYGVVAHLQRDEFVQRDGILRLMNVAGISNVRFDIDWADWAKDHSYPRIASILDSTEREGVNVLAILDQAPRAALEALQQKNHDEFLAVWRPFVTDVAKRYGARFHAIEIWNEENLQHGWWNISNPTNYLVVLKASYEEIKAASPNTPVCLGGVSDIGIPFIRALYELGGAPYFDVVCCHPYTIPYAPEGGLDAKLEQLRALMAEFGDAEKPIWITELGFPTHRNGVGTLETQVLLTGLKLVRPDQASWRVAYAPIAQEGVSPPQDFAAELLAVLPAGSTAVCCAPDELRALLAKDDAIDVVVFPMDSEGYPAATMDAVTDFVRRGGVLFEAGGAPVWFPYRFDSGGNVCDDKTRDPAADRRALRVGFTAWWVDPDVPKNTTVFATPRAMAAGLKAHPAGYTAMRFVTPEYLREGDEFIPLIAGKSKSGKEIAAVAAYKFGSDFKGSVIVCAIPKGWGPIAHSERQQALYLARSILISLASGVEKFYGYEFRATELDPFYSENHFGIVHRNLAPKPAYGAYSTLANRRPAGSVHLAAPWRDEARKLYFPQWTLPDGKIAGAIWTTGEKQTLELDFDADAVTFMDAFGLPLPKRSLGPKRFAVEVSDAPVYFTGGRLAGPSFAP